MIDRRAFITGLALVTLATRRLAAAQAARKVARIGILSTAASTRPRPFRS